MQDVDWVFFRLLALLDEGFAYILPVVLAMMAVTFSWALFRLCTRWFTGETQSLFGELLALLITLWLFLAIAFSAKDIVDGAGNFALDLGSGIVGAEGSTGDLFSPSALWGIGDREAGKVLETKNALCTGTWECLRTLDDRFWIEFCALMIYAAFAFLIFEMATTAIGYKVNGLFMMLFTPMAITPFTKNMSEGAIQGWTNNLVKLTLISMVAGIGSQAFELMDMPATPVMDDIMPAVLMSLFVAWLAWQTRTLAAGIISAVPQLSGQSITRGAANLIGSVTGGARMVDNARRFGQVEKAITGSVGRHAAAVGYNSFNAARGNPARMSVPSNNSNWQQGYWNNVHRP